MAANVTEHEEKYISCNKQNTDGDDDVIMKNATMIEMHFSVMEI